MMLYMIINIKTYLDIIANEVIQNELVKSMYINGKLKYTQSGGIQNYLMAGVLGIVLIALLFQQI